MQTIIPYPELPAKSKTPEKLVVFLHGLGSDGNDLISLAPFFQKDKPNWHFISPNGVEAFDMAPFGRQWFSLNDRSEQSLKQLSAESMPFLSKIISDKQAELGLINSDTIIIGFSQGTMMGISLTLQQKEPFYAMVGFSGRLIIPDGEINKKTPFCLIHGAEDDVVPASETKRSEDYFKSKGIPCQAHILSGLAHSIDLRGIEIATKFLSGVEE